MTNENPNEWSRASRRRQKQPIEPQFARQPAKEPSRYQKLQIALIFASIILLSFFPVYGMLHQRQDKTTVQTTTSSSSVTSSSSSTASSASTSSQASSEQSSEAASSETHAESSASQPAAKPAEASTASSAATGGTVTVAQGQTGFKIAHEAGIDAARLQALNPNVNINALRPGQTLRVK